MPSSFFQYEMMPTTWFYVSALIILASFFKFNRFWSIRNFDLLGIILMTPGLILLAMEDGSAGYAWLFVVGFLFCIRLICDNFFHRRPLLEPNLTPGALAFSCVCSLFFIFAALGMNRGNNIDTVRTVRLEQILTTRHFEKKIGINPATQTIPPENWDDLPPGFRPFLALTEQTNAAFAPPEKIQKDILGGGQKQNQNIPENTQQGEALAAVLAPSQDTQDDDDNNVPVMENLSDVVVSTSSVLQSSVNADDNDSARVAAMQPTQTVPHPPLLSWLLFGIAHLAIVAAFWVIGHSHFGNWRTGIACATLYLLHPYSNQMIGRLDHLVPAALLLWSVALYRRPFVAGLGIAAAASLVWYPVLLVPLWCNFYWHRGLFRFVLGGAATVCAFVLLLLFSPAALGTYYEQVLHLAGQTSLIVFSEPDGFWTPADMYYRIPILALYAVVFAGLCIYPARKHLGTLISCSALLMLGIQFWQLHQGGLYMAWYLPLLVLTVFRPNIDDKTARNSVV